MNYKTSTDYDRLAKLIREGKHVIVIAGTWVYFASYDKRKGYYVGRSWWEHDIEFSTFTNKDVDLFKDFCREYEVEYLDPEDYKEGDKDEP